MKPWKNLFNSHTHNNDKLLLVLAGVGASSMVYQFSVISALTFILVDSLTLFSIFSGTFLFSMGLGAALAETHKNFEKQFIRSQISLAVVGFLVLPVIFIVHAFMTTEIRHLYASGDRILMNALWGMGLFSELIFGSLIGLQLPLLQKIIFKKSQYKMPLSKILTDAKPSIVLK